MIRSDHMQAALADDLSHRTLQSHPAKIFGKLQAESRAEAVMRALWLGWLPPDLGQVSEE